MLRPGLVTFMVCNEKKKKLEKRLGTWPSLSTTGHTCDHGRFPVHTPSTEFWLNSLQSGPPPPKRPGRF